MNVLYKFGNRITGVYPRPAVEGEIPNAVTIASIPPGGVSAGDPGEIDIQIQFDVDLSGAPAVNAPVELHAIAFTPGHGIPSNESIAIALDLPKASIATVPGQAVHTVTIQGIPTGPTGVIPLTIVTVHGFAAPTPAVSTTDAPAEAAPAEAAPAEAAPAAPVDPAVPTDDPAPAPAPEAATS
jgi:hypothetical protein